MRYRRWIAGAVTWVVILCAYGGCLLVLAILGRVRRRRHTSGRHGLCLLLTGRFDSYNWCRAHLQPLADAECVREIVCVVDGPTVAHPKLKYARPPAWLRLILGRAVSKAVWLLKTALKQRPDVVMGYHIFPGALTALLVARLSHAKAVYQMTAGPVEIVGGGINTENPLLGQLSRPSPLLERLALGLCNQMDVIVVRGDRARSFLSSKAVRSRVNVIAGSFDPARFQNGQSSRVYDLVYVGRLMPIKQPSHILRVVAAVSRRHPDVRAIIVGDGPLMSALQREAQALGVSRNVEFMGHVERVEEVLIRSKVVLLTSRSEGLSIGLAEAMAAGVVPVVGDVGDLEQLVHNGRTGWRVPPGDFEAYAARIEAVLCDGTLWARLSNAARLRAHENNSLAVITGRWQQCLTDMASPRSCAPDRRKSSVSERCEKSVTNDDKGTAATAMASVRAVPLPGGNGHAWHARSANPAKRRLFAAVSRLNLWAATPWLIRRSISAPVAALGPGLLLGRRFRRTYCFVREAERWSTDRAREYQLERLREVCVNAYNNSRYYRESFRKAGFEPGDLKNLEDLRGLPLIDKSTVRASLEEMCTVGPRAWGVESTTTSGTSGQPLQFYIGTNRSAIEYAYLQASWARTGYDMHTPMAVFQSSVVPENRHGLRHRYDPLLKRHYYSSFHMSDDHMHRYLEHIRGIGPCYLYVYPSAVAMLARFVRDGRVRPPENIRGIIAESEIVFPEQRRFIEDVFGCRHFSCYGHTEKLVAAAECEASNDYHVWPTYGYFELLDERGDSVTEPGKRGEIVGTGFINTVMPFIRYRTGDFATYVGDRCSACGREHVLIRDIRGHRIHEFLVARGGHTISWTSLNMHDGTFRNVHRFQFLQDTPGQVVLRIVPGDRFDNSDRKRILHNLERKLDGQIAISLETVREITSSPRGKAIYVDQRLPTRHLME